VHRVLFEIDSNRTILNNYISERAHLILISEPSKTKPINYEEPMVQKYGKPHSDIQVLERIEELSGYIDRYQMIIREKEETLTKLKYLGERMLTRMEARGKEDIKLRVFMLSYIDGMSNEQIKEEIGNYEMQTIWNIKTELNNLFKESSFAQKQSSN
jgi:hypothetical protein